MWEDKRENGFQGNKSSRLCEKEKHRKKKDIIKEKWGSRAIAQQ